MEVVPAGQAPKHGALLEVAEADGAAGAVLAGPRLEADDRQLRDGLRRGADDGRRLLLVPAELRREERAEGRERRHGARGREEHDGGGEPRDSRAGWARVDVQPPDHAQHEPGVLDEGHALARAPRRGGREGDDAGLHALLQGGAADTEQKHAAHWQLADLKERLHEKPPPQGPLAVPAVRPVEEDEEGAGGADHHVPHDA
mmetsp:Transcript_1326/g.3596  ORF Transcript_1326/g.3596 Transcript_1326/m.3596 type:complete len:201 (-) Transcript_1326:300-902(-)